jgi:hypothetical protein
LSLPLIITISTISFAINEGKGNHSNKVAVARALSGGRVVAIAVAVVVMVAIAVVVMVAVAVVAVAGAGAGVVAKWWQQLWRHCGG